MHYTTDAPDADIGVVVGRFQVEKLTQGHRNLLDQVLARHRKVILVLGKAPLINTTCNPLDFESRKQMIQQEYPNVIVMYANDMKNDAMWSQQLDRIISDMASPTQTALLYGSRDSFISHYVGKFDTYELPAVHQASGTEVRKTLGQEAWNSPEWRAGVIWASMNRFPTAYAVVDIAIFDEEYQNVLLGRKLYEDDWRFIGGFADPGSATFEEDAEREVLEEAGVKVTDLTYVGSLQIDDWRYRREPDCLKSLVFTCRMAEGETPVAGDDINEVQWFPISDLDPTGWFNLAREHRPIATKVYRHARKITGR